MIHNIHPAQYAIFFVGVGGIMFLVTLTYLLSFLVLKIDRPKFKWLILIAFIQMVLFYITMIRIIIANLGNFNIITIFLYALAVLLLSGLFLVKLFFKCSWKQSLSIWAVAGGFQLVVVPLCFMILIIISILIAMLSMPKHL
jgi:hypothetical protein